jgi:hypothetical protein
MKIAVLGAITLWSLSFASVARAQNLADTINATSFGNQGQVAIAGDFEIGFAHNTETEVSALAFRPALDYFIAPQLSVGGQLIFEYVNRDPSSDSTIGIGPRVGYNIPVGAMFSFYPRLGFGITHVTESTTVGNITTSSSDTFLSLSLYAPFLFHPVPHFFIGLGPFMEGNIAGGEAPQRNLTIGLASTVGGYFVW